MLKQKWPFHEIMQGLEVSFGLPEVAQLLEQERCADTKIMVAPCLAGTSQNMLEIQSAQCLQQQIPCMLVI